MTATTLPNYLNGRWTGAVGAGHDLNDPVLGGTIARVSSEGVDYKNALGFARAVGGPALRASTYAERAALLARIADVLTANKDEYYRIALENLGATRADAMFDIDGAIFALKYYARAGSALGDARLLRDGEASPLSRDEAFKAVHLAMPLQGAAIFINAFNFPAWGLWEKAACALLAGVPVFAKPATATAWLAHRMVEHVVRARVLPDGALSLVCGAAGDLLDHVTETDVVAFTGSADTAARIRTTPAVLRHSTRVNVEADSLNAAILGPDAAAGSPEFDLLIREVVNEMSLKAGQKCTAIRRILVPAERMGDVTESLRAKLSAVKVGNPRNPEVRMGPLVSKDQQRSVQAGLQALSREAEIVFGDDEGFQPIDADPSVSAFVAPTLLRSMRPFEASAIHELEVFGPVATLLPYETFPQAVQIAALGGGSLVASLFSADGDIITAALGLAPLHGRLHIVNGSVANAQTGHGSVMPMSMHGGPGRAGGGQELGGLRALRLYHQVSVVQGPAAVVEDLARRSAELRV